MIVDDGTLYRLAGLSGFVSIVTLVASAIALGLFFGGAGEIWGSVNDILIAIALVALILPMVAVLRLAAGTGSPWLTIVTVAAIGGAALGAIGQVLLVARVIDLNGSYVTGGIGIVPVLAWIVAVVVLALSLGVLPAIVGWLAAASLALIVIGSGLAAVTLGPATWIAWSAFVVVLAVWLVSLSASLLERAAQAAVPLA